MKTNILCSLLALCCLSNVKGDVVTVTDDQSVVLSYGVTIHAGYNLLGNPFIDKTSVGTLLKYDANSSSLVEGTEVYAAAPPLNN